MDYQLDFEQHGDHLILHVTIKGELSVSVTNHVAGEALLQLRRRKATLVLWDIRETILKDSLIQSHRFMEELPSLGIRRSEFVAVLYRNNADQHRHSANVAANRGFGNVQYFYEDLPGAIAWLRSRP